MTLSHTLRTDQPGVVRCDVKDDTGVVTASWYRGHQRLVLVSDNGDHFAAAAKAVTELGEYVRNHGGA
jgi:hypothetical protein